MALRYYAGCHASFLSIVYLYYFFFHINYEIEKSNVEGTKKAVSVLKRLLL